MSLLSRNWGGHTWETLRVSGLGRSILRSAYLHTCTPSYCLKDRSCCRFAFPWPEQPYQVYDENTQRVALMRRHPEDDQWVVPHNLLLMMYSPASVNVICFDSERNCDQARCYAGKYCSKPDCVHSGAPSATEAQRVRRDIETPGRSFHSHRAPPPLD